MLKTMLTYIFKIHCRMGDEQKYMPKKLFEQVKDTSLQCLAFVNYVEFFFYSQPVRSLPNDTRSKLSHLGRFLHQFKTDVYYELTRNIVYEKNYELFLQTKRSTMLSKWIITFWNSSMNILEYLKIFLGFTDEFFTERDVVEAIVTSQEKLNLGNKLMEDYRKLASIPELNYKIPLPEYDPNQKIPINLICPKCDKISVFETEIPEYQWKKDLIVDDLNGNIKLHIDYYTFCRIAKWKRISMKIHKF